MSGGRRIVLHVGLHKTGTSTVQNALYANRGYLLREEGALYPSLAPNLSNAFQHIVKEDPRKHASKVRTSKMAGFTDEELAARRKAYLDSLDAEISSNEWGTLLLSAEGVSHLPEPELARLREWGERYSSGWTVLVCVRHPLDWTRSVVQQRLKQGETLQQLYEKLPTPKYDLKISRAITVFGRENVRVFDFESAASGEGGIVGAFAAQAGLSDSSGDFLASRALRYNESLSLEAARILDSLNRRRPLLDANNDIATRRAGPRHEVAYLRRIKGRKFDVPGWAKDRILPRCREEVAWLNETFGLDLYRDVFSGTSSTVDVPDASGDAAVDGVAEVLGELVAAELYHRSLEQGREALARGNLARAERMLREAARLDPDAALPKDLLAEAAEAASGSGKATDAETARRAGWRRLGVGRRLPRE